jgi:uncharacterized protein YndB with AHSA1/START domain
MKTANMEMRTIEKEISIHAPKATVWEVLLQDAYTRQWYAVFSEGTRVDTDWKEGSKAVFTDGTNSGLVGTVVVNKPGEELSLKYTGLVVKGQEEHDSKGANAVKGAREIYRLSGDNGVTHLAITCDMGPDFFVPMAAAWDQALEKIKQLAEAN